MPSADAKKIIETLGMQPHPEGGWYVETWRDKPEDGSRGTITQIFYLLEAGDLSAWHRVTDATEIWHWHAGAPLALTLSSNGHDAEAHTMGWRRACRTEAACGRAGELVANRRESGPLDSDRLYRRTGVRILGL